MPSGTENCHRAPSELSSDLMDVPEDAPVVGDDALERLLELLLPVLLVELHEDLLQVENRSCQSLPVSLDVRQKACTKMCQRRREDARIRHAG